MTFSKLFATGLAMVALLGLAAGCSSLGIGDSGCSTCAAPPEPACAPPPAPDCNTCAVPAQPGAQPVAANVPQPQGRPPNARPGEVWCYVQSPPVFRTECEQVCVAPARTVRHPIPAEYEDRCSTVCVAPGRTEWQQVACQGGNIQPQEKLGDCWSLREIPPQFQTKTERVCVRPESCRTEVIPAQYQTRNKQICVKQACWEWRRNQSCEVPCAVPQQPGYAPQLQPGLAPQPMTQPAAVQTQPPAGNFAPAPNPAANLPPAGELPPVPTFGN